MPAPSFSTMSANLRTTFSLRSGCSPSPKKTGSGMPQVRWREMHQSGRLSTAPRMRLRPFSGIHFTPSMAASASARKASTLMNHCFTARKTMGVFERQQ